MRNRVVKLVYPHSQNRGWVEESVSTIDSKTIYDAVDLFEEIFLKSKIKKSVKNVKNKILLRDIVNLHNNEGIKTISQIKSMIGQIEQGEDILSEKGLPNIRLVKDTNNKWILFDGHHSMLAYIYSGKKYLSEIPHLIVEDKGGYVSDKDIHVFFGKHAARLEDKNWRDYVINWQAQKEKQLCKRRQNNMGELFEAILKANNFGTFVCFS